MPLFTYSAVNKQGKTVNGKAEAISRDSLAEALLKQGMHPVSIKLADTKKKLGDKFKNFGQKVKLKDLVIFSRQMSTMISAGVPLTRALATMQDQTTNKYFKTVIQNIAHDVEGGMALGDAFAKYPNIFSEIYINMIRAGEAGGILDEIMKRLATQVEQDASMRKKIKGAMTYPTVIMGVTVMAFFGITMFVLPKIGKILTDLGGENAKLPIYTEIMLGVSSFMQKRGVLIIIALIIGMFFLLKYIKTPRGKYQFHSLLLRIPIFKDIIVKIAVARFARTFASLMTSGVTVLEALQVTGGAVGNKVIQKELEEAAKEVKNGKQLSEPLSKSKHFPPIVHQMLAIGEETGETDTILIRVADFYEEEVATVIDSLASIIEPIMILVLGAGVGLIAASVMGPIASLSKNIGH
jgi:type IV pilus assembly protein PilC